MSWNRSAKTAILHIDGDAFFASCEQALHPEYRGKPVVTGAERGIVAAASYEAKALGIQRGIALWDVKKICPETIIVPSDYESYSLFSTRLFEICRRYSNDVEEYGIEEAFVDITGLRGVLRKSYPAIAYEIKNVIQQELGITVSVGLAPTKVLAKVASNWQKPNGFTVIAKRSTNSFLSQWGINDVWGIGPNTAALLKKHRIYTAQQFAQQDEAWIKRTVAKPYQEIWHELNARSVMPIVLQKAKPYQSISKTKTFTPSSKDKAYVFAQLSKNVENACIKARRHSRAATSFSIFLKAQNFTYSGISASLSRASAYPHDLMPLVKELFGTIYKEGVEYRATGVVLQKLTALQHIQMQLFEPPVRITQQKRIYEAVDAVSQKYGKHTIHLGSSHAAHAKADARQKTRATTLNNHHLKGLPSGQRKYLGLPYVQAVVT